MYRTATLMLSANKRRSLALSVHFKQPSFGMTDYEILSRASAFLVWIDPPDPGKDKKGKYSDLEQAIKEREKVHRMQERGSEPAGGPRRNAPELSWLEFCPSIFRPRVHCFASSHVLSPWLWPKYYNHEWLKEVKQEHCIYSLEVYDDEENSLAKVALSPYVIHHPNELDLGMIHLKNEQETLNLLEKLDVQIFHMRDDEILFQKDEVVHFDGFWITETDETKTEKENDQDTRIFHHFEEAGNLIFASTERILASTQRPLPEGMCGGPAIDKSGTIAGIVEGIVPVNHTDKKMAGAASMIPSPRIKEFIDYAERIMLQQIVPSDVFEQVVTIKSGKDIGHDKNELNVEEFDIQDNINDVMEQMKKKYSTEEVEAIKKTVEREKDEVMEILSQEGGDMDEVIAKVRGRTRATQKAIYEFLEDEKDNLDKMTEEEVTQKIDEVMKKAGGKTTAQREREMERKRPLIMEADFEEK